MAPGDRAPLGAFTSAGPVSQTSTRPAVRSEHDAAPQTGIGQEGRIARKRKEVLRRLVLARPSSLTAYQDRRAPCEVHQAHLRLPAIHDEYAAVRELANAPDTGERFRQLDRGPGQVTDAAWRSRSKGSSMEFTITG